MTYFTIFHWMFTVVLFMLFSAGLFSSIVKLRGQMRILAISVLFLVIPTVAFIGYISIDKSTKKAIIKNFENRRILRNENIEFSGDIVNVGNFKIGESKLEIKLINHGTAVGRVKGTDFYQPNSWIERLFSSNKGSDKVGRPSSIVKEYVIARNLKPGERRKFKVRFRFPAYFKDVAIRHKLYNH